MANESPLKLMYLNPVGTPDYDGVRCAPCRPASSGRRARRAAEVFDALAIGCF